jgi:hypothetical protein
MDTDTNDEQNQNAFDDIPTQLGNSIDGNAPQH